MASDDRGLLDEQIAYYRARAAEYDETSTPPGDDPFVADTERIRDAIRAFKPRGRVLELAAGTGQWTGLLAEFADELTVTDASAEMLELNAAKVGDPSVRYRTADVFALDATHDHDAVFFGFFLSHVPSSRFQLFWSVLHGLLAPGGRVFLVDEAAHGLWAEDWIGDGVVRRTLLDGTAHRAVKVLWEPSDLEARLDQLGWRIAIEHSGPFLWGGGSRQEC